MIDLKRIDDRVDPGCVVTADPDGAYLFVAKHKPGWIQITVIGQLAELDDYVAAAEQTFSTKFAVDKIHSLEIVSGDPQFVFKNVKRGFVGIILKPAFAKETQDS